MASRVLLLAGKLLLTHHHQTHIQLEENTTYPVVVEYAEPQIPAIDDGSQA
jgi:hypothetical protein